VYLGTPFERQQLPVTIKNINILFAIGVHEVSFNKTNGTMEAM
jgi:hypothetical protein